LELPPIPENRDWPGRLQVPDLEPAPIEADVSFYKGRLEALRGVEIVKPVPGAVCARNGRSPSSRTFDVDGRPIARECSHGHDRFFSSPTVQR
jgi:hypothetical protein